MKKLFQLTVVLFTVVSLFITCSKDDNTVVQYSLSVEVNPIEGGSVSPSSGKYDEGEVITLLATPSAEYIFKNWSGGASGTSNPTTTIINSDKAITAVFEKRQYPLAIEIEGQGTVTEELLSSKPASNFPSGSSVRLTAVPLSGWEFVQWSGDKTGVDNPITISIDKPKNIKVKFQPVLYNQILGKWDVNNLNGKPSSKKSISNKIAPYLVKTTDGACIIYSLVFNSDGSFILSLSSGEINGTFYFDSANSIVLNNHGKVDNIHINNNVLNFHLNLNNLCSSDETADDDEDYVEGECVSFLDCNDGNVWLLQTSEGQKFIRVTNNLENIWIEHYTFDVNRQCISKSMTNKASDYSVILLENNTKQMTYVLDNTPNGDVSVILSITADNHLSVKYDYINNALDETDYYAVSAVDSLNEYLNSYSECPQLTYVPDDNFEQSLINLGYDDVLDDYVITNQISGIEELYISVNYDLTGIEDFTNLIDFSISSENLTVLNLSDNVLLEQLRIYTMKLNSINITQNIQLKSLTSWGEPLDLNSIDISNNKLLTTLDLISPLTSIDISHNTLLTNLSLACQLSSIDVSANTALTNLYLSNNQLTSIDISANTALINFDLRANQLTCIQVNQTQLNAIPYGWYKDANASYSLDCNSQTCETFLECLEGTVWLWNNQDYYIFNNNPNNPFTDYEGNFAIDGSVCYEIQDSNYGGSYISIIENSKNTLIFKTGNEGEEGNGNHTIISFINSNGQLSSKEEYFENNVLNQTSNYTYSMSSVNVNSLTICN